MALPDRLAVGLPAEDLFAERITEQTFEKRKVRGPQSIGGVGDWAIGNGTICAIVSDVAHEAFFTTNGGQLVDLGHCDAADDQWTAIQLHLRNMRPNLAIAVNHIDTRVGDGRASIVTRGESAGIAVETTYWLDQRTPRFLRVDTRYTRTGRGPRLYMISDTMTHGHRSLAPFVMSTRTPSLSKGFRHPESDPFSIASVVRAMHTGDLHILVGSEDDGPGISYGLLFEEATLVDRRGRERTLSGLALNGEHFTLQGIFVRPLWLGGYDNVGWLQFMQTPFMNLKKGEAIDIHRLVVVGERADTAAITDLFYPTATRVGGHLDDADARVHVVRDVGPFHPEYPFTMVRPEPSGAFSFRAPPGEYRLEVDAAGEREATRTFDVAEGDPDLDLGTISMGKAAWVRVRSATAVRLVFVGEDDTASPRFGDDHLSFSVGHERHPNSGSRNSVDLAGTETEATLLTLAPGRYRVLATRGPEFDVTETALSLAPGQVADLHFELPARAFETPEWLAADLHVHSSPSFDSTFPSASQVRGFAAMGGEVIVSTEHDYIVDYAPLIARLGLEDRMRSVVGTEATSTVYTEDDHYTLGHGNVFPVTVDPTAYRQGAFAAESRSLRQIITALRALPTNPLIQINHPRKPYEGGGELDEGSFFTHLGTEGKPFRPDRPLGAKPNRVLIEPDPASGLRALDFDAIELMNGPSRLGYRRTRADWLSLLLQGEIRTATANSDSHDPRKPVGLPRTYVRTGAGGIGTFDEADFIRALRHGYAIGSSGPWLAVDLAGAGPGESVMAREGVLRVRVEAAPWVPVSEVRIRVNGKLVHREQTRSGTTHELPLRFEHDSFVFVEVEGEPTDPYTEIFPGFVPLAFANPVFVDADGDGAWSAPGLPAKLPDVLTDPDDTR